MPIDTPPQSGESPEFHRIVALEAELAQLRKELADSKTNHAELVNAVDRIGDIFLTVDKDWRYRYVNPMAANIVQRSPADMIGKLISDVIPGWPGSLFETKFKEATATQQPVTFESRGLIYNTWYETTVYPSPFGLSIYGRDISLRRQSVQALRESETKFRAIFDGAVNGILLMNLKTGELEFNDALCRMMGGSREELMANRGNFLPPHLQEKAQHINAEMKAKGYWHGELPLVNLQGELVDMEWWGTELADLGLRMSVINDIRQRKRHEAEREELLNKLASESDQLQKLTAELEERVEERTHEVRSLAGQLSLAEQAERTRVSQILHDSIQQMLYGVQWRTLLIRQEMEKLSIDPPEKDNFRTLLADMERLTSDTIQAARTLTVELSPPVLESEGLFEALTWLGSHMQEVHALHVRLGPSVAQTPDSPKLRLLIFQIVRELLFNVVKHAGVNEAEVSLAIKDGEIYTRIQDNGRGFRQESLTNHTPDKKSFGLRSIRERVALFGGQVEIRSTPGQGTAVTVILPVAHVE